MLQRLAVVLALLVFPASAGAHGLPQTTQNEKQLRAEETRLLGPEHAKEHAELRAILRNPTSVAKLRAKDAAAAAATAHTSIASADGAWGRPKPLPVHAIHAVNLYTGKVLIWAYPPPRLEFNLGRAFLYDPKTGLRRAVTPPINPDTNMPANIWCAGQTILSDGRVLVVGGNREFEKADGSVYYKGLNQVFTFDPRTEKWTIYKDRMGTNKKGPDNTLNGGRWYPTVTALPDGRAVILSGINGVKGVNDPDVEVFNPRAVTRVKRGVGIGNVITKIGVRANNPDGVPGINPPDGDAYPHVFVMPRSGDLLIAGPKRWDSWYLKAPFPGTPFWLDAADEAPGPDGNAIDRYAGNGVMLNNAGDVMQIGGGADTTPANSTATFDGTSWVTSDPAHSLNVGRSHLNTVLLPDKSMVTVGGGLGDGGTAPGHFGQWEATNAQRQIELWNPTTGAWRLGPAQREFRAYHSTALLLPDGSVMSAGDDLNNAKLGGGIGFAGDVAPDTAEIYKPPYMFKSRPKITAAPRHMTQGGRFFVKTKSTIASAVLMAPAAVTHANDMHQRRVDLSVANSPGGVSVTLPRDRNLLSNGYYMLFLVNGAGVPSTSKWVYVGKRNPRPVNLHKLPKMQKPAKFKPPEKVGTQCGDLNYAKQAFVKKGKVNAWSVTARKTSCYKALLFIIKHRSYDHGKKKFKPYTCNTNATSFLPPGSIEAVGRTQVRCAASKRRLIRWQIVR